MVNRSFPPTNSLLSSFLRPMLKLPGIVLSISIIYDSCPTTDKLLYRGPTPPIGSTPTYIKCISKNCTMGKCIRKGKYIYPPRSLATYTSISWHVINWLRAHAEVCKVALNSSNKPLLTTYRRPKVPSGVLKWPASPQVNSTTVIGLLNSSFQRTSHQP